MITQSYIENACSGCTNDEPVEMATSARIVRVWVGDGTFAGIDRTTTIKLIRAGLREMDSVCRLRFEETSTKSRAKIKIEFKPNIGSLGQAWRSGRIEYNSTRKINNLETRRVVPALTEHEIGHVYGLKHDERDRGRIMHPWLGYHWGPWELEILQRNTGLPSSDDMKHYPTLRKEIGDELRENLKLHDQYKTAWRMAVRRNQWPLAKKMNDKAVLFGRRVAELNTAWWVENKLWNTSKVVNFHKAG